MEKKIILVDQDGVIADWYATFNQRLMAIHPDIQRLTENLRYDVFSHYDAQFEADINKVMDSEAFYSDLQPIEGAVEALHEMLESGLDVRICTAPYLSNYGCASEKYAWITQHFGKEWGARTILTLDKTLVHGDAIIDDKIHIKGVLQNAPAFKKHILFDAFYNRTAVDDNGVPLPRLDAWKNWKTVLDEELGTDFSTKM